MRNLKKFLALVLAMMMIMGMMVTANATGFTDDANISADYREAMEVLSGIGVFTGDNGQLNPKSYIRRAEFAIVLYRMVTGDVGMTNPLLDTLDNYFIDVDATDNSSFAWAEKAINYAAFMGWLEGDSGVGGTFRPNDYVTCYEVLVSLLRVLGKAEGTGGSDWPFKTAVKASELGLTDGAGSLTGSASREKVGQMAFNALLYTEEQGKWYTVEASNGDIIYAGTSEYLAMAATVSNEGSKPKETTSRNGSLAYTSFKGLQDGGGSDQFMRPAIVWSNDDGVVASIPETPVSIYDGTFNGAAAVAIENANGGKAPTVYYNGVEKSAEEWKAYSANATPGETGLWNGSDKKTASAIPGFEVEVYKMDDGTYRVVVCEAYVGQIATAASSDDAPVLRVYDVTGGEVTSGSTYVAYNFDEPGVTAKDHYIAAYNTVASAAKGTILAVYVKPSWKANAPDGDTSDILEVAELTAIPTNISRITDTGTKFTSTLTTSDGAFKVNRAGLWNNERSSSLSTNIADPGFGRTDNNSRKVKTGTATLYTLNGTSVLFIDQVAASASATTGYGYLKDIENSVGWYTEKGMYSGRLYLEDGTMHTVPVQLYQEATAGDTTPGVIGDINFKNLTEMPSDPDNNDFFNTRNGGVFVYYEVAEDDDGNEYYKLIVMDGNGVEATNDKIDTSGGNAKQKYGAKVTIDKGVAKGSLTDASSGAAIDLVFDNATTFYVVTGQPNKETVTVYTGISSLPSSYKSVSGTKWTMAGQVAYALRDDVGNAKVVQAIVLRSPSSGGASLTNSYFIVGGSNPALTSVQTTATQWTSFYEYTAVINGEITTMLVDGLIDEVSSGAAWQRVIAREDLPLKSDAQRYGHEVVDLKGQSPGLEGTKGQIDTTAFVEITDLNAKDVKKGGVITLDATEGYLISDSLKVFQYNGNKGTVKQIDVTDLKDHWKGYFVYDSKIEQLTYLFVMDV